MIFNRIINIPENPHLVLKALILIINPNQP